jgi:hypothetical protein
MTKKGLLSRMCLAVPVSLLLASVATAQTEITVTEQTQAAIQTALNRLGGPGTVILPPGRYQVDGTLRVRTDGVTLQGAGADQTVLYRLLDGTNTAMVRSTGNANVRITGIRFEGVSNVDPNLGELSTGREVGVLLENAADFRVDNCSFTHTGFAGVRTNGASWGVVDHSTFDDQYKPRVGTDGYGVVVYGIDALEGEPFGSGRATFVEDSSFSLCRHAVASNKGARYVFRYNYVALNEIAHAADSHGHEYGSTVGTEWIDVNNNLIEDPIYRGYAVRIRGGMGLVWSNAFIGYNQGIELTQDTDQETGPVYIWDNTLLPDTSPMVRARGTMGTPTYSLSPPSDYVPYPYPHPLAAGARR